MDNYTVYIVVCNDNSLYTGIAKNIEERIALHNTGKGARYTRGRRPVVLVYHETCPDKSTSLKREHAIKRLTRQEKENLIKTR